MGLFEQFIQATIFKGVGLRYLAESIDIAVYIFFEANMPPDT